MAMKSPLGRSARLPLSFRSPEPEYASLQRTADTLSLSFEQECRRDVLLTEQSRMLEEELRRRKDALPTPDTAEGMERKLKLKVVALRHELHLAATMLAETQTNNRKLRKHIDAYRRDLTSLNTAISSYQSDFDHISHLALSTNTDICAGNASSLRCQTAAAKLRSKSVHDRLRQNRRLAELTAEVRLDQTNVSVFVTEEKEVLTPVRRNIDLVDPIPIQRRLLRKWKETSKSHLDHYYRHIHQLRSAFSVLSTSTGITSLSELVSLVLKSHEQHYSQHSLLLLRTAEAESLSEELFTLTKEIDTIKTANRDNEKQGDLMISGLKKEINDVNKSYIMMEMDLKDIKAVLGDVCESIAEVQWDDHESRLSEGKIMNKLAGIERLIDQEVQVSPWKYSKIPGNKTGGLGSIGGMMKTGVVESLLEDEDAGPMSEEQIRSRVKVRMEGGSRYYW